MILISFCCICCAQLYILKGMHQNFKQGKILIFFSYFIHYFDGFQLMIKTLITFQRFVSCTVTLIFWLLDPTLVSTLNEHMLTDSDIWGIHLSKITHGFYAWLFQYGLWAISHHSNALFPPEVMALISSNLAMPFPSLIRNLILGSISEQLVGNYSKWFKTHFINGPVYS